MAKKSTTIEVLLTADGKGLSKTLNAGKKGLAAFNKSVGSGNNLLATMHRQILGLAGAFVGLQAIGGLNQTILDASVAGYALESSLKAANREFAVGSADQWADTIKRLSAELKIYSDTDLRNAAARTVDMTKRLGMSEAQMETIIALTGDLSAGKTTLEGGIERVTAALRGEAEASEYLGLTLNETYVKGWYEASGAHEKAWKELNDLEKAQVRYQVFLEQSIPLQGKAAGSVTTYAGAIALVKKEFSDGITGNKELVESLKDVADVLSDNAEDLGAFASSIASGAAAVIEFVANNRELIVTVGKWSILFGAAAKVIGMTATTVRALNAALLVMTGMNVVTWLKGLGQGAMVARAGLVALASTAGGVAITLLAIPAAAGFAAVSIAKLVIRYRELKKIESQIAAQQAENELATSALADQYAKLSIKLKLPIKSMADLDKAVKDGKVHYNKNVGEWVRGAGEMAAATNASMTTIKQVTGSALDAMKVEYQAYAEEIKRLQDEIAGRELSLTEQLRAMGRSGMSGLGAWEDRKKEADEYALAAENAMGAGDYKTAVELADKAKIAYADLNKEVKDGEGIAISQKDALVAAMKGVEAAGKLSVEALKKQQDAANDAMDALTEKSGFNDLGKGMADAKKKWLDSWTVMRKSAISDITEVEDRLLAIKDKDVTIYINEKVKKASGGLVNGAKGYAVGGKVTGPGGIDKVSAWLTAGEVVVKEPSVRAAGLRAALAFNAGNWGVVIDELQRRMGRKFQYGGAVSRMPIPSPPRFAAGGAVGAMAGGNSVTINLYDHAAQEQATLIAPTKNDYDAFERMQRRKGRLSSR